MTLTKDSDKIILPDEWIPESVLHCPLSKKRGELKYWKRFETDPVRLYAVDCSSQESKNNHNRLPSIAIKKEPGFLYERQDSIPPTSLCPETCNRSCTGFNNYSYNADDCDRLSRWMTDRGASYIVQPGEKTILSWGTCMFTFINQGPTPSTWCDSQWAQIGSNLAAPCQQSSEGGSGECYGASYLVQVLLNDGSTATPSPLPTTANADIITSGSSAPPTTTTTSSFSSSSPITSLVTFRDPNISSTRTLLTESSGILTAGTGISTPTQDESSGHRTGAIIGGLIGFLAISCILFVCYLHLRRRKRRSHARLSDSAMPISPSVITNVSRATREYSTYRESIRPDTGLKIRPDTGLKVRPDTAQHLDIHRESVHTLFSASGEPIVDTKTDKPAKRSSTMTLDMDPFRQG